MNLGIYIPSISDANLKDICETINFSLDNKKVSDASLFYDDISHNPFYLKCGTFNSTDLWNFSGNLIVTSISCLYSARNIVNNINIIYYYGLEDKKNLFLLLDAIKIPKQIVCKNEESANYIHRISGKRVDCVATNFKELLEKIS